MPKISRKFNNNEELELIFSQTCKNYKLPVPIPIKFSFLDEYGKFTKFNYGKMKSSKEHTFILNSKSEKILIPNISPSHVPSFLRGFSAPVSVKTDLTQND